MAHGHDDHHDHHDHHHGAHDHSTLGPMDLRVRALETVLAAKGYIDTAALDVLIDTYQTRVGPRNGARVVAKAWADPAKRAKIEQVALMLRGALDAQHMVGLKFNLPRAGLPKVAAALPAAALVTTTLAWRLG